MTELRAALFTALRLSLGVLVALGFARFAYALLLPAMRDDLFLSYTTLGSLNTANAVGYLLGALLAAPTMRRFGPRAAFLVGIGGAALALLVTPASGATWWLLLTRVFAGLCGAVAFTAGSLLVAHVASGVAAARRGLVLSVYYAGGGLGILLSGLTLPETLAAFGPGAWRACWLALGGASFLALLLVARGLPSGEVSAASARSNANIASLGLALIAYALFALGYIAYMTFSVALLRSEGAKSWEISAFWCVLGLASMGAPLVWGRLLDRERGGRALAGLLAGVALGAALPLVSNGLPVMLLSGVLFGGSFLSVVAATTALVRHNLPSEAWGAGVARFTVVFAVFQTLGPVLVGLVADRAGGLQVGLGVSAALLMIAATVAALQRPPNLLDQSPAHLP